MLLNIYNLMPAFLQNMLCSAAGLMIKRRRYGRQFHVELDRFEHRHYNTATELVKFLHAVKAVPAYGNILSDKFLAGLNESNVFDMLQRFPVISKEHVKSHFDDFVNISYTGRKFDMHTSGTTGSGLGFPYAVEMENKQWAVWWRYRRNLGIGLDTWCGWFGGRTITPPQRKNGYFRINYPGRQVMFSSYHLNISTVEHYHREIVERGLTWLHGYPSSIARIAALIAEKGLPPVESVTIVTTGAENLYDYQINIINRAFPKALVRQHYGLSEGVANFSQDIGGNWHTDDDFCYVEFIPLSEDEPAVCRIVGTGFANPAFPLIRYDTGDIAIIEYAGGRPVIKSIDGRSDDYITLPSGVKLGRLGYVFKSSTNIKEAQIHQRDLFNIELRIVANSSYGPKDEKILLDEARSRFGRDVNITVSRVDKIEWTRNGKLRLVISDIK